MLFSILVFLIVVVCIVRAAPLEERDAKRKDIDWDLWR